MSAGPFREFADRILESFYWYRDYHDERLSRDEWIARIDEARPTLEARGLLEWHINVMKRMVPHPTRFSDGVLAELKKAGIVDATQYDRGDFDRFAREVKQKYDHRDYLSLVFSEEAMLLFAVGKCLRPKKVVVGGSSTGYFAIWAMPGIALAGGDAVLLDVDQKATDIARLNFANMGFASIADIRDDDAVEYARAMTDEIDVLVLDASGGRTRMEEDYRGYRVYRPFAEAFLPKMKKDGLIIAHRIHRKLDRPADFIEFVDKHARAAVETQTTSGMSFYKI